MENIYLTTAKCDDGDYEFFINYFRGAGANKYTFVVNQFGEKVDEGTGTLKKANASDGDKDQLVTITMKKKKVVKVKFHRKVKSVPLD